VAILKLYTLKRTSPLSFLEIMQIVKRKILIVEDDEVNQMVLIQNLEELSMSFDIASNGQIAIDLLESNDYDVVLLDLVMPVMNGKEVLRKIKSSNRLNHLPVIVISSESEFSIVIECIEMGALDYLPKPFDPILLKARLKSSLITKDLYEQQQIYLQMIKEEQRKLEMLLFNMLPFHAAYRLRNNDSIIADKYDDVSVMFIDIVGFTKYASHNTAEVIVNKLNTLFTDYDKKVQELQLEKIKTIGDSYMIAGGIPNYTDNHLENIALMGIYVLHLVDSYQKRDWPELKVRIGIHTGPLIGGVIGQNKFTYDLWGDTVNIASRMESHGIAGKIQVSEEVYERLKDKFDIQYRGSIEIKGKGSMKVFILEGKKKG